MSLSGPKNQALKGLILNVYPDSMGPHLSDLVTLLEQEDFKDIFSCLYILPSMFHSDLDRGFSVIDYDLNQSLVRPEDLERLRTLGVNLKLDIVLNHLSVGSPEFKDLMRRGDDSPYLDFFIDWNKFWSNQGTLSDSGVLDPMPDHKQKLFMRKPGLPVLQVPFPDHSFRPYWNTFYQKISLSEEFIEDCKKELEFSQKTSSDLHQHLSQWLNQGRDPSQLIQSYGSKSDQIHDLIRRHLKLLGQMDLNASFEGVWQYYEKTLSKLKAYGAKIVRLDAFAYLHKAIGATNFFNTPGTWEYLNRLKTHAADLDMTLLPEIHAQYGKHLHDEVSEHGFPIYDFFLPGLIIHALEAQDKEPLLKWAQEIQERGFKLINMLGCHDGIPLLDLDQDPEDENQPGLLSSGQIESLIEKIVHRGGRIKNLFGPDGQKIAYYQVNATFFSALGEDPLKLMVARALQLFMPGTPQIWYLDLFAGVNDHEAADAGPGNHKEINRTNLSVEDIDKKRSMPLVQKQLSLLRTRGNHSAFNGKLNILPSAEHLIVMRWEHENQWAELKVDLSQMDYSIQVS